MEQIKSITTTAKYATINGSKCVISLADAIIGKRKNSDGDVITSEANTIVLDLGYVFKVLVDANLGIASAVRRSGNAASSICAALGGAKLEINVSLAKAGEAYDEEGHTLEYDKYNYEVVIKELDKLVDDALNRARLKDLGL